jgi:hypothetical protein
LAGEGLDVSARQGRKPAPTPAERMGATSDDLVEGLCACEK